MNERDTLDLMQAAISTVVGMAGPAVLIGMCVGVAIALIQALTQVQETTLTFVPKIATIVLILSILSQSVGADLARFADAVFSRIETGF